MIKAEVVFDGDYIFIGDFEIKVAFESGFRNDNGELVCRNLEQAIKYCLEKKYVQKHENRNHRRSAFKSGL